MKYYYLTLLCLFFHISAFSQTTSVELWQRTLSTIQLSEDALYEGCPHFPIFTSFQGDNAKFSQAVKDWETAYVNEVAVFWTLDPVVAKNPSAYYLGLSVPNAEGEENGLMQWVKASKISESRLKSIAPNFPWNVNEDVDFAIEKWIYLYGHEYNRLLNDRQLTALNPYYEGEVVAIQIPSFISALISKEKPIPYFDKGDARGELQYQLSLQNWYFVFSPGEFESMFGFNPSFPEWFDVEDYRRKIIERIEANEEALKQGLSDPNEIK